ncbi:response regulator [Mariniblastus sp.]|mgnify:CR=1 FL=1|nr:response regulator [Mariniblastus sp.]MDA7902746.1 response regulator [Mariniblastus sp.]MDA7912093.1 response regulator [bacterium]MDB4368717.1 response regulator [bacterium]
MSGTLRISICDPDETTRENLKRYLIGMDQIWLEADCSRYEFFAEIVSQTTPEIAIIDIDSDEEKAMQLVEAISKTHPSIGIIVVSNRTDGQMILRAMRSGAREFLNSPIQIDELVGALDRVAANTDGKQRSNAGNIIAVAGASGGVGNTSIAVNLAVALATNPERSVVLIDLDLALGDADVFLDMIPDYTLLDVAQNISRLDLALLRKSLTKHESGVYLLPRPVQIEDMSSISNEDLKRVIGLLKASFTHLIIDLSKSYSRLDITALESANSIVLLTQLDLPCLRNVVRLLSSLETYDDVNDKIRIVVNRVGLDKMQISSTKAEETIDRDIFWRIPNNYPVISECRNNGVPLLENAKNAAITQSICELAEKLSGDLEDDEGKPNKKDRMSWLKFLGK